MKLPKVGSLVMVIWRDIETCPSWEDPADAVNGERVFESIETVGRYMGLINGCHYVAPTTAWADASLIHRVSSTYKIPTGVTRGIVAMRPPRMVLKK